MNSEYKYEHILEDEDRHRILKLVLRGTKADLIAEWHGLTSSFIKAKFQKEYDAKGIDIGSKSEPYYANEMDYGNNNISYNINELSKQELKFYNEYRDTIL